jgi:hypothetical protein
MIEEIKVGIYTGDLYTDEDINAYSDYAILVAFCKCGLVGFGQTREEAAGHLLALMKGMTKKDVNEFL